MRSSEVFKAKSLLTDKNVPPVIGCVIRARALLPTLKEKLVLFNEVVCFEFEFLCCSLGTDRGVIKLVSFIFVVLCN